VVFRFMAWADQQRWRWVVTLALPIATIVIGFGIVAWMNSRDRAETDATFLAQCHEAGYDAAKCRFFLTAMSRANASAAMQMMIETPK
jgi:hypothetical protein